jgi:hypothetical protein
MKMGRIERKFHKFICSLEREEIKVKKLILFVRREVGDIIKQNGDYGH